ncbi:alpha/beta hydrolase [Pelomonas sp. SE-A7]|uniref:alpha/beta fold hydrolase n=1 Tax=Pelomonas sp. SE-A7 TaxID=3054953 RepID=UPI00259D15B1|nr:alpha/beta hydrolase [Pelomonas sp. SE-A7]MDM4766610.1 alpha/beta hydrolase [Pelomonas sp. SE-A7]
MPYFDRYFLSDDGLRLYARDYPGPAPDAPVVLCLPGLTRNSKDFAALAGQLNTRYRVICPDLRGRGHSARDSDPARYRPDRYCADMLTLLGVLGIPRVSIVGTSLGGLMAVMMAAMAPILVHAIVLNDVGPELDPRGIARIAGYVGKQHEPCSLEQAVERIAAINGEAFPDFGREDWLAMVMNTCIMDVDQVLLDYDPEISQGVANGSAAPNLWPLFQMLGTHPVLAIRGALSDILAAATLQAMTERLPSLEALEIPGRGHAPTLDEPAARAAIVDFLARHNNP